MHSLKLTSTISLLRNTALALAALGLSQPAARAETLSYFTASSATTLQGWHNRVWNGTAPACWVDLDPDVTTMPSTINGGAILPSSTENGLFVPGSGGTVWVSGNTDAHLNTLWLRSPVFYPGGSGNLTVEMAKGIAHTTWTAPMDDSAVPYQAADGSGWEGVALRRVSDNQFVIIKPKTSGNSDTWYTTTFTQAELAPYVGVACTLDLINSNKGSWGWLTMRNVSIPGSFSVPPADAGTSTVTASPATVASDGVTTSTVTVTLKDATSAAVPGKTVTLASSRLTDDTISAASGPSNDSGVVTFTVKSSTAGAAVFTATDTTDSPNVVVTQTATVTFVANAVSAANSTVTASPTSIAADGSATSTITVTLKDATNSAVIGKTVTLAKTSGSGSPTITTIAGTTDGSGVATFTVKSTTAGADVFTATGDSVELTAKTVTVTFTAGAVSAGTSTVVAAPATVPADGTATSTVTVTLLDSNSNPLAGKTVTLASSRLTDDAISAASGVSSAAGVVTFTVKSSTPGSSVITAIGDSVALSTTPTVTFTAVSAANSTVTASPATVVANGSTTSTITVTLKDASGNLFAGKAVSLAHTSGPGSPVITTVSGTTSASGVATFTVKSVTVGADVFTATDDTDSLVITPTATVTFTQPAATITWGPATDDTLNAGSTAFVATDVKTNGEFVAAVTNGNGGTVNGVTFTGYNSYNTAGTYLITYGASPITMQWAGNRGDANWGSPSSAYGNFGYDNGTNNKLLLTGGGEGLSPGTITLSSLIAGRNYQVQIWAPTWNNTYNISVGGVNLRVGYPPGTVSQYVVGTFTATGASQPISWSGVAPSAISLRDVTPVAALAANSTVTASPTIVASDGVTTSTITVTLKGAGNAAAWGKTVTLASSRTPTDTISPASGISNDAGVVTFSVKSTTVGTAVFTATDVTDSNLVIAPSTASVTFSATAVSAAYSTVEVSPATVMSDGTSTSTVTVTLKNASNAAFAGQTVTLTSNRGASDTISPASGVSNISGVVTFTVKSTTSGTAMFTASVTDDSLVVAQTGTVNFIAGAVNAAHSTVTATPSSVSADGSTTATIAVTLKDANNNPVAGKSVTLARNGNTGAGNPAITTVAGTTNAAGVATFKVACITIGAYDFQATDVTDGNLLITQAATVTFTPGLGNIMPMGDSITDGGGAGGYRDPLYTLLHNRGDTFSFVGSATNNATQTLIDAGQTHHEGHSGYVIALGGGRSGLDENLVFWIGPSAAAPDKILLMIGSNDINLGYDMPNAPTRLSTLITHIYVYRPNVKLYVASIIPMTGHEADVQAFNATIPGIVANHQALGRNVVYVPMYEALNINTDLADGLHPNALGYQHMAQAWDTALHPLPYDTWSNGTFANGTLTDKTPTGDPDGDGLTNQQEFAFGLDPTTGASVNPCTPLRGTQFSYTRRATSGLSYTVEYSTDLTNWNPATVSESPGAADSNGVQNGDRHGQQPGAQRQTVCAGQSPVAAVSGDRR